MEPRYRLISLRYDPTVSTVLGEFVDRIELEKEHEKRSWKGDTLFIDFLIDGVWCRGNINSCDPIAWIK